MAQPNKAKHKSDRVRRGGIVEYASTGGCGRCFCWSYWNTTEYQQNTVQEQIFYPLIKGWSTIGGGSLAGTVSYRWHPNGQRIFCEIITANGEHRHSTTMIVAKSKCEYHRPRSLHIVLNPLLVWNGSYGTYHKANAKRVLFVSSNVDNQGGRSHSLHTETEH